jgi:hypothetical protein
MPSLPSATLTVSENAVGASGSSNLLAIFAAVATNADMVPRVYSSSAGIISTHGYSEGADFAALYIEKTRKPVVFVGLPIVTSGTVGRVNTTGNSGTATPSIAGSTILAETDGQVLVETGGTLGTDAIVIEYSLNDGEEWKRVKLAVGTYTYAIPNVGLTITVGSAGQTLVAGDTILTWHSTAPLWDSTGLATARAALANQQRNERAWFVVGDLDATAVGYVKTQVNLYETSNERFKNVMVNARDRLPLAIASNTVLGSMSGNPNVTFTEVGATADTIGRSSGSFVTDGFANGDWIRITGSVSNNTQGKVTTVAASTLTLDTCDLANEGPVGNVTITAEPTVTFAEVGATGDTITRSRGSWVDDGFRAGDRITITGSSSNNITNALVSTVTDTVITLDTQDLAVEEIGLNSLTITAGETVAQWVSSVDSAMSTFSDDPRIDIALGRGRIYSSLLNFTMRRPASWGVTVRQNQKDIHIPSYRKADGKLDFVSLYDSEGDLVEFDERVDGGALSGRFTCYRTYANGPKGAFVALDLTRAQESSLRSRWHNQAVVNEACAITHAATEDVIGQILVLKDDGTAEESSLVKIEQRVNGALERALLQDKGEGPRASKAVWTASRTDLLNYVGAQLTGVLDLRLNGTVEQVATAVKVS